MITCTLADLLTAEPILAKLAQLPLPVKTAYHLARLTKTVATETAAYHEARNALVKQLGTERPATTAEQAQGFPATVTSVDPARMEEFTAQMTTLQATAVSIDKWTLTLALLGSITTTAADLLALGPLLLDAPEDTPTP